MPSIVRRLRSDKINKKKKTRSDTASTASDASSAASGTQPQHHNQLQPQPQPHSLALPQHLCVSTTDLPSSPDVKHLCDDGGDCSDGDVGHVQGADLSSSPIKPLHLQHSPDASVDTTATAASVTPCSVAGDATSDGRYSLDGGNSSMRPTRLSFQNRRPSFTVKKKGNGNAGATKHEATKESPTAPLLRSSEAGSFRQLSPQGIGASVPSSDAQSQADGSVCSRRKGKGGLRFSFRSQNSQTKVPGYIDTTKFLHKSSFRKTTVSSRSKTIAASLCASTQRLIAASPTPQSPTRTPQKARQPASSPSKSPTSATALEARPVAASSPFKAGTRAPTASKGGARARRDDIVSDLPDVPSPDKNDDAKTAMAKARAASAMNVLKKKEAERIARAAAALDNQGNELFEKGYFDKAMAAYTKALKLKRRTFNSLLEDADEALLNRSDSKDGDGDDNDDDDNDRDVTNDNESVTTAAKSDPRLLVSMATSINNIGYLRQRSGDATLDETMAAYRKSLRIKREILGKDNLSVGKTLNNIGSVYYLKRDFSGAISTYTEALQIMQSNLGAEHPDVATVWSNIGDVYLGMRNNAVKYGEPEEIKKCNNGHALEHYRRALSIRWAAFGDHDPRVIRLLEKIAAIEMSETTMMSEQLDDVLEGSMILDVEMDEEDLPVAQQLHILHDQCIADVQYIDWLQKKMALDMVKDKVHILRGMRELSSYENEQNASVLMNYSAEYRQDHKSSKSIVIHHNFDHADDASVASTMTMAEACLIPPCQSPMSPAVNTRRIPVDRSEALKTVKDRLARIRSARACDSPAPAAALSPSPVRPVKGYLGTSLRATDEVDTLRSALVLKQGIMSLRSHREEEER